MFTPDNYTLESTLGALRTAIQHAELQAPVVQPLRPRSLRSRLGQLTDGLLRGPAPRSPRRAQAYLAIYPAGAGR